MQIYKHADVAVPANASLASFICCKTVSLIACYHPVSETFVWSKEETWGDSLCFWISRWTVNDSGKPVLMVVHVICPFFWKIRKKFGETMCTCFSTTRIYINEGYPPVTYITHNPCSLRECICVRSASCQCSLLDGL